MQHWQAYVCRLFAAGRNPHMLLSVYLSHLRL